MKSACKQRIVKIAIGWPEGLCRYVAVFSCFLEVYRV